MPFSYLRSAYLVFLALACLGSSASAQPNPFNFVSGVDSCGGDLVTTFYTVPTGQRLVLTDLTTDASPSHYYHLLDNGTFRYSLSMTPVSFGGFMTGSLHLTTGLVFNSGHTITLVGDSPCYGFTGGRFSWSGYFTPDVSGVAPVEAENRLGFTLFPNPAKQVVTLQFVLTRAADVRLGIYDVQGRLVRTVSSRRMGPGRHVESWDGKRNKVRVRVPAFITPGSKAAKHWRRSD